MRRRILDAVELVILGALIVWIVSPIFSSLAARLAEGLETFLRVPSLHNGATGFLFAAASVMFAVARLRRRSRGRSAERSSRNAALPVTYAGLGLLLGALLSGDWMSFGSLAGARVAAASPAAANVAGIAIVISTIVLLYRRSERRGTDAKSERCGCSRAYGRNRYWPNMKEYAPNPHGRSRAA